MITQSALDYAKICEPHTGKSATSADKAGKYIVRPGEVSGEIQVVKGWFAIGQEVCLVFDIYFIDVKALKAQGHGRTICGLLGDRWHLLQHRDALPEVRPSLPKSERSHQISGSDIF